MTSRAPLLSFIVLNYNYEPYVSRTIESILEQTVQDFEIIIVDDGSSDKSVDRIRSFSDPRIRLIVNPSNLGFLINYNRAVDLARGEWLVNLDSDDWIAPRKSERQLAAAAADPRLDIIGTYVTVIDTSGARHSSARAVEAPYNQPHDYQHVDSWIGANTLCRSSTIIRRATQLRLGGFNDLNMARAWDYELWTRAVCEGCRFGVVPEPLTYYRLHSGSMSQGHPLAIMLEVSYAMLRNLMPLVEARAANESLERMVAYVAGHDQLSALRPIEAYRLVGMFLTSPPLSDYADFRAKLSSGDADPALARVGERYLTLAGYSIARREVEKLRGDGAAYVNAVKFWRDQSVAWESAYRTLSDVNAVKFWRDQSVAWESAYRTLSEKPFIAQFLGVRRWIRNRRVG